MVEQLTGILYSETSEIPFILEDFIVKIFPPHFNDGAKDIRTFKFQKDKNGFIHGVLYCGEKISIWIGDHEIECRTEHHIHIGLYMLSSSCNEKEILFQGISVFGDPINIIVGNTDLTCKNIIELPLNNDGAYLKINTMCAENLCNFGRSKKVISRINFEFSCPQPFDKILNCFCWVQNICKFMTYRSDSYINTFTITAPNKYLNDEYTDIATCFVKLTSKINADYKCFETLSFNDIGEENIIRVFNVFNPSTDKSFYLNFLPSNKEDANYINIIKIKEICSALECELNYVKLNDKDTSELRLLKRLIRKVIKYHKNSGSPLKKNKTYDRILGEMKYWNLSLSDKIMLLSDEYSHILVNIGSSFNYNFIPTYEDICEFVKLRNNNSHGTLTKVSKKQAKTAFWMIGLVYCCLLKRIGLDIYLIEKAVKKLFG